MPEVLLRAAAPLIRRDPVAPVRHRSDVSFKVRLLSVHAESRPALAAALDNAGDRRRRGENQFQVVASKLLYQKREVPLLPYLRAFRASA
jgi:hypothetical protein